MYESNTSHSNWGLHLVMTCACAKQNEIVKMNNKYILIQYLAEGARKRIFSLHQILMSFLSCSTFGFLCHQLYFSQALPCVTPLLKEPAQSSKDRAISGADVQSWAQCSGAANEEGTLREENELQRKHKLYPPFSQIHATLHWVRKAWRHSSLTSQSGQINKCSKVKGLSTVTDTGNSTVPILPIMMDTARIACLQCHPPLWSITPESQRKVEGGVTQQVRQSIAPPPQLEYIRSFSSVDYVRTTSRKCQRMKSPRSPFWATINKSACLLLRQPARQTAWRMRADERPIRQVIAKVFLKF